MAGEIQVIDGQVFQTQPDSAGNDVAVCIQDGSTYRFRGYNAAGDDKNFDDLCVIVRASGGMIELEGHILLSGVHYINDEAQDGSITQQGLQGRPGHKLLMEEGAQIIFGISHDPYKGASEFLFTDAANGGTGPYPSQLDKWSILQSNNDGGGGAGTGAFADLNVGDWTYVIADHDIQEEHANHVNTTRELPCELVRVIKPVYQEGSNTPVVGQYFVDGHVHDKMLYEAPPSPLNANATFGNVRISKPTPTYNVIVRDVIIETTGSVPNTQCLQFQHCFDSLLENLRMPYPSGGNVQIRGCGNFRVLGGTLGEKLDPDKSSSSSTNGYGFIDSGNKNLLIDGVAFGFVRHVYTTGAVINSTDPESTPIRAGSCRNTIVTNCSAGYNNYFSADNFGVADQDNEYHGQVCFDCHAEGIGVAFVNNKVNWARMPSGSTGSAFSTRGRYTVIQGNTVVCPSDDFRGYGVTVNGPFTRIVRNNLQGGWAAIIIRDTTGPVNKCYAMDNLISGAFGNGIYIVNGDKHQIVGNRFIECAKNYTGSTDTLNTCIRIVAGTEHVIRGNIFATRGPTIDTAYSVSIIPSSLPTNTIESFTSNDCVGFGTDLLGFDVSGNGQMLNDQFLELNWCEKTHVGMGRKDNADPAETYSPTLAIDFDAGEYDNKVVLLEGDMAPTFTATRAGDYTITVAQDVTGYHVITWPNNVSWQGQAPQPDPLATRISTFRLFYNGTTFQGLS